VTLQQKWSQRLTSTYSRVLGRSIQYVDMNEQQALEGMLGMGTPEVMARGLIGLTSLMRIGFASPTFNTVSEMLYRHPYTFEQCLRHFVDQLTRDSTPKRYKFGILGSGDVARALGAGLIKHGHEVMLGSREANNEKAVKWASENGPLAKVGTFETTAMFAEIGIVAVVWTGVENALKLAGPDHFKGKIVIDVTNPIKMGTEGISLAVGHTTSGGELVQTWLPHAMVVKTWNIVGFSHMIDPTFKDGPPTMFVAGNDSDSKNLVSDLLKSVGWEALDAGDITGARLTEPLSIVWIKYEIANGGSTNHALKLLRK